MKRNIYIFPSCADKNEYIDINISLWKRMGFNIFPLSYLRKWHGFSRKDNIAILNWVEDSIYFSNGCVNYKVLIRFLVIVFYIKLACSKVIWVRHNIKPHIIEGSISPLGNFFLWCLTMLSTRVVTHAPTKEFSSYVIPHPLYSTNIIDTLNINDKYKVIYKYNYLCFGVISKYKNIDGLLSLWPVSEPLLIIGGCNDDEYLRRLRAIALNRKLDVEIICRHLSHDELNFVLDKVANVVIPHHSDRMIVSGAFFHAISHGCNVVMNKNSFYENYCSSFPYVRAYSNEYELCSIILNNDLIEKDIVKTLARDQFGSDVIKKYWYELFGQ